jgi:hypothetical protein
MDVIWLLDRVIAYLEAQHAVIPETIRNLKLERAPEPIIREGVNEWRECNELLSQLRDFRGDVAFNNEQSDEVLIKRH